MPVTRHFLDWKEPALPAAADWLAARYAREAELDLGQVIVVVPGGRAGRRLLELLVARAESRSLALVPPTITTEQALPELLYEPQRPFANQLTQRLAWAEALRETPSAKRRHFLPHPPAAGDTARWLELGELLRRLHVELAADGLDFRDVLTGGQELEHFAEHDRWRTLADIQARYLRKLDELGLWDIQTARLVAIRQREPQTDRHIVLLGMVDLNRAQRQLLDLVASRVTALVVAPSNLTERFDQHGCLVVERWTQAEIPLADEQIVRADGPADQADEVTRWLASLDGSYRADEIVVGLPDGRLAAQVERQLAQCGVGSRWYEARKVSETGPFRLLALAAEVGHRRRFSDLAALVRHPDVFDWLQGRIAKADLNGLDPLTVLDRFAMEKVPASLDAERLARDEELAAMRAIFLATEALRSTLPERPQPLAEWASAFRALLLAVYGERQLDRNVPADRFTVGALKQIDEALSELEKLPAPLVPTVGVREAFQLAIAPVAGEVLPPPAAAGVIELLGWLELPLDDAPALIVTSFNEGLVPKSNSADLFLPNRLRQKLGLLDNDRRYARDAYAASVLIHSRRDLRFVVAKRDSDGNPLAPSRLLFAADEETVARRALELFGSPPPARPRRNLLAPSGKSRKTSALPIVQPLASSDPPLAKISVTAFKSYLACPYRYYLRHVLRLEPVADRLAELEPTAFGTLLHDVLQRFGRADDARKLRATDNPEQIFAYLSDWLDTLAAARYGLAHCRPAVSVQVEQARSRLGALADWQARRNVEGWQIVHSEDTERQLTVEFALDERAKISLQGRIDRIDFHAASGTLAILDYKTSETGQHPHVTHQKQGAWIDLQLPLYRHLVRGASLPSVRLNDCRVTLGYILLPKDVRSIGLAMAEWPESELLAADEVARQVLRNIRDRVFWPPVVPPPAFSDDFAVLTQDHALGGWTAGEGDAA